MSDILDDLIEEIQTELNDISGEVIPYKVEERAVYEHSAPPRIVWVDAVSGVDSAVLVGGNDGSIATDLARFAVHIWHKDRELTRNTLHNLIRASRNVVYGPNIAVQSYQWQPPAFSNDFGRVLIAQIELAIPISNTAVPTAVMTSQGHEVTVDGEVVC